MNAEYGRNVSQVTRSQPGPLLVLVLLSVVLSACEPGLEGRPAPDGQSGIEGQPVIEGRAALEGPSDVEAGGLLEAPVEGTLHVPVFLLRFKETPDDLLSEQSEIASLFDPADPGSLSSYYDALSDGRLQIVGDTDVRWVSLEGPRSKAMSSFAPTSLLLAARDSVQRADPSFDWGQYDNDGPDDVPNSGDDDGIVDVVVLVHSELGKECTNVDSTTRSAPATSRQVYALQTSTSRPLETHTVRSSTDSTDSKILINEYVIMAGQGGDNVCTRGAPPPIGPIAHEFGHILGIPELYNNQDPPGPGIGRWGLMGLGGVQTPAQPLRMSAWPLTQLGWLDEVTIDSDVVLELEPVVESRRVHAIVIPGTSEYLLLANRQPVGSDASLVVPSPIGGQLAAGLLIWHVDSIAVRSRGFDEGSCWKARAALCRSEEDSLRNTVNSPAHQGVKLETPDGSSTPLDFPFNPYDSTIVTPGAALRPGAATTFTYPGFVRIEVLEEVAGAPGTLRVDVDFLDGPVLRLGEVDLPIGTVTQPYSGSVSVVDAVVPQWSVVGANFPPGLTLSSGGVVTGTPKATGIFPVVALATAGGASLRTHFTITIANLP